MKDMVVSGFSSIDKIIGGFMPSSLYVIAERSTMVNSVIGANLAYSMSVNKSQQMLYFSLIRSNVQMTTSLISMKIGISADQIKKGELEGTQWKTMDKIIASIADAPMFLDDTIPFRTEKVCSKIRNTQCDVVVIDGFCIPDSIERTEAVQRLKTLSVELEIPIILITEYRQKKQDYSPLSLQWKKSALDSIDCLMLVETPLHGALNSIINLPDWAIHSPVCFPRNVYSIHFAKHGICEGGDAMLKIDLATGRLADFVM